jgi:catechol 2,3-dioxygenase-like lactoylglutathione lyase family enzyme
MLADRPIHTTLPATDLERARRFYAEKLGLTPETELPDIRDGLFYHSEIHTTKIQMLFVLIVVNQIYERSVAWI